MFDDRERQSPSAQAPDNAAAAGLLPFLLPGQSEPARFAGVGLDMLAQLIRGDFVSPAGNDCPEPREFLALMAAHGGILAHGFVRRQTCEPRGSVTIEGVHFAGGNVSPEGIGAFAVFALGHAVDELLQRDGGLWAWWD